MVFAISPVGSQSSKYPLETVTIEHLPLGVVEASLNTFKRAIDNAHYVNGLITKNIDNLKNSISTSSNPFVDVLSPLVKTRFYENKNDSWIVEFSYDKSVETRELVSWNTYSNVNGFTPSQLRENRTQTMKTPNGESITYGEIADGLDRGIINLRTKTQSTKAEPTVYFWFGEWTQGIQIEVNIVRPNPLNAKTWLAIGACVSMVDYTTLNLYNIGMFSESYQLLLTNIGTVISGTIPFTSKDTIWEYGVFTEFSQLKCIQSETRPEWNNQFIRKCYIPNSDAVLPDMVFNVMKDIESNYGTFFNGQKLLSTFSANGLSYVAIVNIIMNEDSKINIQIKWVEINDMFPKSLVVKGDMTVNGNVDVRDYANNPIFTVQSSGDNITTLRGKLGINQEPYEVNGLLDIDNLSTRNVSDFVKLMHPVLLDSFHISNIVFGEPIYENVRTVLYNNTDLNEYKGEFNEFFAFSIDTASTAMEINYLYYINQQEVNAAKTSAAKTSAENKYAFDSNATLKIQQLAREVAQIQRDTSSANQIIFSFVEQYVHKTSNIAVSIKGKLYGTQLVCIATYVDIDVYMVDLSYKKLFRTFIDGLSSTNRLVNYASTLMQNNSLFAELKNGNSVHTITDIIRSGEFNTRFGLENAYLFCDYVDDQGVTTYLFHEYYTQWNGEIASDLYLSEINLNAGTVLDIMTNSFRETYGDLYQDQTFMVAYDWHQGYKVTSTKYFIKDGITYRMSCGINVNDFVGQSIIAKGDTRFTGDFSVQTPNQTEIFKVSTRDKLISSMFNVGIGTQTPKTALDIRDCSITNILQVINKEIDQYEKFNQIIRTVKRSYQENPTQNKNELIRNTIEQIFPSKQQTHSDYFTCCELNMNTNNADDATFIYHWLFKKWEFIPLGNVIDAENDALHDAIRSAIQEFIDDALLYDNSLYKSSYNFLYGYKRLNIRFFLLGNVVYFLGTGIDLQANHLHPATNVNVANWVNAATAQGYMLSDMVRRFTKPDVVYNKQQSSNILATALEYYPNMVSNTVKVVLSTNFLSSTISQLDFETLDETDKKVLSEITDINDRTFATTMLDTIRTKYSQIYAGDYGIFRFEDTQDDYRGYFYATSQTELFVLYLRINEYIIPSFDLYGDARIKGDLLLSSDENNVITNFVSIDPSVKYVGINTDERKLFYQDIESYTTLTSNITPSHHMVIRNDKYPNVVMERIQEATFGSNSAATMKRTSQIYTHDEIQQHIQQKYPNNDIAHWETKKTYGPDISFEIMDKTGYTREIGHLKVVVDKYDHETGDIYAGFGVQTFDPTILDGTTEDKKKNLMYVDHTGTLFINKIQMGGKLLEINGDGKLTIDGVVQ